MAYLHFCNRNECAIIFFFPIDIKTTARRDGDDLIINGSKMWITNGAQADYMCLLANTNQGPAHKSKSLIVLPMNLPGIAIYCLDISYCICVDPFLFSDLFAPWKQYKGCFNYKKLLILILLMDYSKISLINLSHLCTSHMLLGYKTCSSH